jgi:hypothetical protein
MYLDRLTSEGKVFQITRQHFVTTDKALKDIDPIKFNDQITKTIEASEVQIVEADYLREQLNPVLQFEFSKDFYRSYCIVFHKDLGLYVRHYLISKEPIEFQGISDVVDRQISEGKNVKQALICRNLKRILNDLA